MIKKMSINKCLYCGGDKDEVLMMSNLPDNINVSLSTKLDCDPCKKCEETIGSGIIFVAGDNEESKTPTGKFRIVDEKIIDAIIKNKFLKKDIKENRICMMSEEDFNEIDKLIDVFLETLKEK